MQQPGFRFLRRTTSFLIIFLALAVTAIAAPAEWLPILPEPCVITAISIDPVDPSRIYAAGLEIDWELDSSTSHVFTSTDGGRTWIDVPLAGAGAAVPVIAPDRHRSGHVYLAKYFGGVFETTDGGRTWTRMSFELPGEAYPEVLVLATDPVKEDTLFLGTRGRVVGSWGLTGIPGHLWKSTDGGKTWDLATAGIDLPNVFNMDLAALAINPVDSQKLYAATPSGVYGSSDGARTWTKLSAPRIFCDGTVFVRLQADPRNWDVLYLSQPIIVGIQKSTDGGKTWREANRGLQSLDVQSLILDPTNSDRLFASAGSRGVPENGRIYVSLNGGETWDPIDPPLGWAAECLALGGEDPDSLYAVPKTVMQIKLPRQDRLFFPQMASGTSGGWELRTEITLVNMGPAAPVTLEFFDPSGAPLALSFGDRPPGSSIELQLANGETYSERTQLSGALSVGHAIVDAPPGVSGYIVFSCSRDGEVLYETGVPGVRAPNRNFTLFVDSKSASSDVGLAMANAGKGDAGIVFRLYDEKFHLIASRTLSEVTGQPLPAGGQLAKYAKEIFPEIQDRKLTRGTMTVESDQDLAAMTLHQRTDGNGRLRISTFPVIPLRADLERVPMGEPDSSFAHIINGEVGDVSVKTELMLINTSLEASGGLGFHKSDGSRMKLELEGYGRISELNYTLAPGEVLVLETTGRGEFQSGWLTLVPWGDIHAFAFVTQQNPVSVTEAAVLPSAGLSEFSFVFDASDPALDTGFAVACRNSPIMTEAMLRLFDGSGTLVATHQTQWAPTTKNAKFATELFPEIREKGIKKGVISINANQFVYPTIVRQHQVSLSGSPQPAYRLTTLPIIPRALD